MALPERSYLSFMCKRTERLRFNLADALRGETDTLSGFAESGWRFSSKTIA
jgi:hypothetical protein